MLIRKNDMNISFLLFGGINISILLFGDLIKHVPKKNTFAKFLRKSFFFIVVPKERIFCLCVYPSITAFQSFHCLAW